MMPSQHSGEVISEGQDAPRAFSRIGVILDIALPLIAYYTLHSLGSSDWAALMAATAAASVRLIVVTVLSRRVSWFAAIMLVFFGVGLALAFVGGDPRFLLLKDSFSTALLGALFLSSLATRHPFALVAAQASKPADAEALDRLYRDKPLGRRAFRISTLGWGVGLLIESVVRVPLVYLLPVQLMVGLSTAMLVGVMAALTGWNILYLLRAADRHSELRLLLPSRRRP